MMTPTRVLITSLMIAVAAAGQSGEREKLLEQGRWADAFAAYRDCLRAEGPSYEAFMGLGRACYGLHDLDGAIADFERAAELDPQAVAPLLEQGRAYMGLSEEARQRGNDVWREHLRTGAGVLRRAAALAADPFDARRLAAECAFRAGDGEEALADADAALAARPGDDEARWLRARCLFAARRYEEYLAALDALGRERDLDVECSRLIALARLERHDEVEAAFLELQREYPDEARPYVVLGAEWSSSALTRRRVASIERIAAADPENTVALYYLGIAYGKAGRFAEGAETLARYLALRPKDVNVLCDHSQLCLLAGDVGAAHASARKAITLAPGNADARARFSAVIAKYVEQRAFDRALDSHELLVVAAPEDPDVARNHAALLKENGELEEAALRLESLVESADVEIERVAVYLNDLALCLKGLGRMDEAEKRLREAIETWPFQIDARENLGVLRYEQGRIAEAEKPLAEALDLHAQESPPESPPRYRSRYYLRRVRALMRRR